MPKWAIPFVCVVCLTAGAEAQVLVHTSQRSPGAASTQASAVAAAGASEFLDSIGVACHLNYSWTTYRDFKTTKALLVASGIRNIRDGGTDPLAVTRLRNVGASGLRVTWVMEPKDGVAPNPNYWTPQPHYALNHFLKDVLGTSIIDAVEVSNEIDIFYKNKRWHPNDPSELSNDAAKTNFWGDYILALTKDTNQSLKLDPAFSSIHLVGPSFGGTTAGAPTGSLYGLVDFGTFHPYMYRGNEAAPAGVAYDGVLNYFVQTTQPTIYIDEYPTYFRNFQGPYTLGPDKRAMVATETGYYTGGSDYSISELAHAKYIPRVFAEYFRHGIEKTFIYEFLDEGGDGGMENSFGLVRSDFTPKPAYTALQSLIALLQDGHDSFTPGTLTYGFFPEANGSFTRTQYAHDLLLEKRDGDFFLLFWHEISDANRNDGFGKAVKGTDIDVSPAALPVTITLPDQIVSATLYAYDAQWKLQPETLAIHSHRVSVMARDRLSVIRLSSHISLPGPGVANREPGPTKSKAREFRHMLVPGATAA
jgi:hypothetical protein